MTSAIDYTAATRTAQTALTTTLDSWKHGLSSVTDQFRAFPTVGNLPQVDVTEAVERQFTFIQQIVDLNHEYARQLAEVANTLTGVTRKQFESVGNVVREQVAGASELARTGAETVEQTVREQADQAVQAERKQAEEKARAPYADLTKAELSELAAKRDLPKTGTVEELIQRLVEADAK